jgi:hypothetical protein
MSEKSTDAILHMADSELRDRYPTIDPHDIRRLRAAFLEQRGKPAQQLIDDIDRFKKENGL